MSDISSIKLPDNSSYNVKAKKIFYAECSTAKSDVAKVVTCSGFVLEAGAMIAIRFTDTTTTTPKSGNITLNINNTGAKNIVPKGNNSVFSYGWGWAFCNNQTWLFMYNGTYFVCMNQDNNTTYNDATTSAHGLLSVADKKALDVLKTPYATCATARSTAAKVATLANFSLNVGATIAVKFTDTAGTANPTSGNLTLNVNSTGAKTIGYFKNGSKAALNYSSAAYFYNNSTHIFTYDGTYWLCMDWNADTNTDTKVTSAANHYTPAKSTTKSASGGTLTDITNSKSGTQVVTGVEMDAKGHVTGVTAVALKSTDTKVTVDSALSSTSTNPVQNKAVYTALAGKAASSHTHSDYALKSLYGNTTINVGRKSGTTVGDYSTAEGYQTTASGNYSHAEGFNTTARGDDSHAEGSNTTASGNYSHAGGSNTKALHDYEVAYGRCNQSNNDTLFSIGDGTSDDARHNAFEITTTGGKLHDKDISTTPIKSTTVTGSTNGYGAILLWPVNGDIPISALGDASRIFSVIISENHYYLIVQDSAGHIVTDTAVSATVFYI